MKKFNAMTNVWDDINFECHYEIKAWRKKYVGRKEILQFKVPNTLETTNDSCIKHGDFINERHGFPSGKIAWKGCPICDRWEKMKSYIALKESFQFYPNLMEIYFPAEKCRKIEQYFNESQSHPKERSSEQHSF